MTWRRSQSHVNRIPPGCWYELIEAALKPEAIEETADDGDGTVLRWRKSAQDAIEADEAPSVPAAARHDVPGWLRRDAAPESAAVHAISPSAAVSHAAAIRSAAGDARGLARGRIVHRLLQALPALPPERRSQVARKPFARAKDFGDAERDTIIAEVLAVLDDARFAPLFAKNSRAEVPIVGYVGGSKVSGQVDRLALTESEVLIADYKSDRFVPRRIEDVPQGHIEQLALYRAVLRLLYPNHAVRAALVWTLGPTLMELPAARLDDALSRLTRK